MSQQPITVTGHITHEPRLVRTGQDKYKCEFSVASSRRMREENRPGEWRDYDLVFISVEVWDQFAINVRKSLHKGMPVVVVGSLVLDSWQDNEGNKNSRMYLKAAHVGLDLKRFVIAAKKLNQVFDQEGVGMYNLGDEGVPIDDDRYGRAQGAGQEITHTLQLLEHAQANQQEQQVQRVQNSPVQQPNPEMMDEAVPEAESEAVSEKPDYEVEEPQYDTVPAAV